MSDKINSGNKVVARNRKARFLYDIEDRFEAGVALRGTEVKSLREGKGSLAESFVRPHGDELFIHSLHIPPYEHGNIHNVDSLRERKLLLHRREIDRLIGHVARKGYTLVPLSVYFKDGRAKIEIALARGRKAHDKRDAIKRREQEREMDRATRERRRE